MNRNRAMAAIVLVAVLTAGCASFEGGPVRPAPGVTMQVLDPEYWEYKQNYDRAEDEMQRTKIRNAFIDSRQALIDRLYADYRQDIYRQRTGGAVGTDIAILGLNVIGAGVASTNAKTALHALSGGIIGSKASIDKNAYFDRTLPAMLTQMDGSRLKARILLHKGMLVDSSRYTLADAYNDLENYRNAGTILGAIDHIETQAVKEQQDAAARWESRLPSDDEVADYYQAKGFNVERCAPSESRTKLQGFFAPENSRARDNRNALRGWLKNEATAPTGVFAITDFLCLAKHETLRRKLLSDSQFLNKLTGPQ